MSDARHFSPHRNAGNPAAVIVLVNVAVLLAATATSTGRWIVIAQMAVAALDAWFIVHRLHPAPTYVRFLPMMRIVLRVVAAITGTAAAAVAMTWYQDQRHPVQLTLMSCVAGIAIGFSSLPASRKKEQGKYTRIAVIGTAEDALDLRATLHSDHYADYVTGWINVPERQLPAVSTEPPLGDLGDIARIITEHQIDLILIAPDVPRLDLFEELSATCLHLPIHVMELAAFYEQRFGRVPLASINAAWFQYLMHPRYEPTTPAVKRAIDLLVALPIFLVLAPVLLLLMALVRRDGGPAIYRQVRVGEAGKEFEILKLRSMRIQKPGEQSMWTTRGDSRITPIGKFLRASHLDEIPQLINVIRGDMSIIGPRPEQPAYVRDLEQMIPFYTRRHAVRPGLTGWAQVLAGYCGSHSGSAIKTTYDLYYLKHRSLFLDLMILGETARTLVADRQWQTASNLYPFIPKHFHSTAVAGSTDPVADSAAL